MMQSISDFYQSRESDGIPKRNTHDIADFNVQNLSFGVKQRSILFNLNLCFLKIYWVFLQYSDKYADYMGFPHLEEWRRKLCKSAILNSLENLETYRDSWDDDDFLQETLQNPYFTQLSTTR